jgi:hypothetical protein
MGSPSQYLIFGVLPPSDDFVCVMGMWSGQEGWLPRPYLITLDRSGADFGEAHTTTGKSPVWVAELYHQPLARTLTLVTSMGHRSACGRFQRGIYNELVSGETVRSNHCEHSASPSRHH